MKIPKLGRTAVIALLAAPHLSMAVTDYRIVGWNNLGMHCMDSDFSVFSILPPYNTVHGQVVEILDGNSTRLLTAADGFTVTYEAVADPDGSVNSTSVGKSNFWEYALPLYGAALAPDQGLPVPGPGTRDMPGPTNTPKPTTFEVGFDWFAGYGIPITPYDDSGKPNQYPMMRLRLKGGAGTTLATTDVVLPVSDEMDCKLCHLSGSGPDARPEAGWVDEVDPGRDYRLNILRLHDERQSAGQAALYAAALAARGFPPAGLYASVTVDGRPVLCASCHLSEALPDTGYPGIKALTAAVHGRHAGAVDPRNGLPLDAGDNRAACYTCHPGSTTRCLRGAMGKAVAEDGSMSMQCQSCHGPMSMVGDEGRTGWLEEPTCQACHAGDALDNPGQIRYLTVFVNGAIRVPSNRRFATNPDTPASGLSLYRFSRGHGGLQCSACHGSTHAEYPSAHQNDNIQSGDLQGHRGMLVECTTCHGTQSLVYNGGPHGMHPLNDAWAKDHPDIADDNQRVRCAPCHGTDYRGTVLSRAQANRTITTEKFGPRSYWRGQQIGCYGCHDGPNTSDPTSKGAPTVTGASGTTDAGVPLVIGLSASTADVRIVSQPGHGTVGLSGKVATYYPDTGFSGSDSFTFAATNGYNESALGTVNLTVNAPVGDNGIPDWWESLHFGGACDPNGDEDGDGLNNLHEYQAQTDPLDGRSHVRLTGLRAAGENVILDVASFLGQRFTVERTDELVSGIWESLTTSLWGRTDTTPFADPTGTGGAKRFYRVGVIPGP